MKNQFTPGNWIYNKYEPVDYGVYSEQGDGRDIAIVRSLTNEQESEANAQLISAAPDLLEALQMFIDCTKLSTNSKVTINTQKHIQAFQYARSAIQKAINQ